MEETILKTNLEAVQEIAYQLRFRNIGGLIILDLIDMERRANREKVRRTLEELLQKDKAKTTLNRISDLGLIEMTRKRTRESLGRLLHEPCFYCDGTGQLQSKETIAYEILREMRRERADLPGYTVIVNAHPAVADFFKGAEKAARARGREQLTCARSASSRARNTTSSSSTCRASSTRGHDAMSETTTSAATSASRSTKSSSRSTRSSRST